MIYGSLSGEAAIDYDMPMPEDQFLSDTDRSPISDPNYDMRHHTSVDGPSQGALFASDELILPDSIREMRKPVSAIHVVPVKAEYAQTLNSRRLFDAVIISVQNECRGKEKDIISRLKSDRVSPMFELRVSDLAELAGIPGKNYERLYDELDKLFDMQLAWNIIAEDQTVEYAMKAHFFSVLGHGKNFKKGMVRFAFDASVLEIILEPSRWAKLSLEVMGGLKTPASYALYANCFRYFGTANKVTAALPTLVWIELLVGKGRYVLEHKDGTKEVNYGDFKRRCLLDALRRVNSVSALSHALELKEIRSGNRIAKLQFRFIQKDKGQLPLHEPLGWSGDVIEVLNKLSYSSEEINNLAQAYSIEEVCEALKRLTAAEARMREQGKGITARRPYFEGILRKLSAGAGASQLEDDKIMAEVRAAEIRKAAETRKAALKDEFQRYQRNRFSDWLFELPENARDQLLAEASTSPSIDSVSRAMLKKGVSSSDYAAQAVLRIWMQGARLDLYDEALPNPEDRVFEEWVAWKASGGDLLTFS